ncbi:MAG: alpha/beta fold hydrolase [Candidatus Hodarchaeota archaeon]
MTADFAFINGINICYKKYGKGYPLILVSGFSGTKEGWIAQIGTLSEKFEVIIFDNRSSGKSDHPNEPITMQMFADDLKGLMDFLQIERAHLVGQSLGGMIVQQFTLNYPKYVNKLVLMNTTYSAKRIHDILIKTTSENLNRSPEEAFWELSPFLYHQKFRGQMKANPKKKFYNLFSVEDLIKIDIEKKVSAQDLINQAHSLLHFNSFNKLNKIKNPVLLIASSNDILTPLSFIKEMNEIIPNSILKIIHQAGHMVNISNAPEINKTIIEFLENNN